MRDSLKVPAELAHSNDLELLRRNVVDSESLQSIAEELGFSRELLRKRLNKTKTRLASRLIEHRELLE